MHICSASGVAYLTVLCDNKHKLPTMKYVKVTFKERLHKNHVK